MDALYALASHPLVTTPFMGTPAGVWLSVVGVVIALLAFDLGVLHRDQHEIGVVESLWLSAGYIAAACAFGAWLWWLLGSERFSVQDLRLLDRMAAAAWPSSSG